MEFHDWLKVAKRVFDENKSLVFSTYGEDGTWTARAYFAEEDGYIYLALEPSRALRNVQHHPRVSFAVDRGIPDRFLQGEGDAEIIGSFHEHPRERRIITRKCLEVVAFARALGDLQIVRIRPRYLNIWDLQTDWKPRQRIEVTDEIMEYFRTTLSRRKSRIPAYIKAVRHFSFTATAISVLVGALLAPKVSPLLLLLTLITAIIVHAGVNVLSDNFDFVKGVDDYLTIGSRVLVDEELDVKAHRRFAYLLLGTGIALGLLIAYLRGPFVLYIGLAGYFLGVFYCGVPISIKYRGLGDLAVFLAFGPLMTLGSYYVQAQSFAWAPALAAIPVGFLVIGILHGNNMRDAAFDARVGARTVASMLGPKLSGYYYAGLVAAAYALVIGFVLLKILPPFALLVLLTYPTALRNVDVALHPTRMAYGMLDLLTARLHLSFGLLLCLALFVSRVRVQMW
ncbi:MAG: UbiA family prenyltransferase [bacterium JZ-2024 1]